MTETQRRVEGPHGVLFWRSWEVDRSILLDDTAALQAALRVEREALLEAVEADPNVVLPVEFKAYITSRDDEHVQITVETLVPWLAIPN